jgi:heat shock protein HspQ
MEVHQGRFCIGQVVHHRLFDYRGVIIDVDPNYQGTFEWYASMAATKPPKNDPWYYVLVDGAIFRTYVAERNLEPDVTGNPVNHPELSKHFDQLSDGFYVIKGAI